MSKGTETSVLNHRRTGGVRLFGNLRVMAAAALLSALSVVLGKYLAISTELFRISFENLPILMAGLFFGPLVGGVVGAVADLVGCLMVGYAINPLITLGGASVGVVSGLVAWYIFPRHIERLSSPRIFVPVMSAHAVGSMLIKSAGMSIYFGAPIETLVWRVPLYLVIGATEGLIVMLLMKNKLFAGELTRLLRGKRNHR